MTLLTADLIDIPITEFKYYKSGVSDTNPTFGLYDTISNRFLILSSKENIVIQLRYLLSSRYHLHICRIDSASNYGEFYISNENCDRWTLSNRNNVSFSSFAEQTIIPVDKLCIADEVPRFNVLNEKLWCLLCMHWLYILNNDADGYYQINQYYKLDEYLNSFLNINEVDYNPRQRSKKIVLAKNDILKLLYLGRNLEETELAIKKLIK